MSRAGMTWIDPFTGLAEQTGVTHLKGIELRKLADGRLELFSDPNICQGETHLDGEFLVFDAVADCFKSPALITFLRFPGVPDKDVLTLEAAGVGDGIHIRFKRETGENTWEIGMTGDALRPFVIRNGFLGVDNLEIERGGLNDAIWNVTSMRPSTNAGALLGRPLFRWLRVHAADARFGGEPGSPFGLTEVAMSSPAPRIIWYENDQADVNERAWAIRVAGKLFTAGAVSSTDLTEEWLRVIRGAGATIDLIRLRNAPLGIDDGITAPTAVAGVAQLYVDVADGDLKVIFADGTVKTIVTDT